MTAGPGQRSVIQGQLTIDESRDLNRQMSTLSSSDVFEYPVVQRKPAALIADSMGECFLQTDRVFAPMIKQAYVYEWIAKDLVEGALDLQRYKNIIIWAGAHAIHQTSLPQVELDLKGLINVILPRNPKAAIFVSTLIPKPRENHYTGPLFQAYNDIVTKVVTHFAQAGRMVYCLNSHQVFLDDNNEIIRPIIDNFVDGFHLNYNGSNKLRDYWMQNLVLA